MNLRSMLIAPSLLFLFVSCKNSTKKEVVPETPEVEVAEKVFINKGHELVSNLVDKVGDHQALSAKKDVIYTYTYTTPDGKSDVSTEKYIFDGELSYGKYEKHQRTLPKLEGVIEQGYDGSNYWLKHNGAIVNDTTALKRVAFSRPTNYYWFAMFQKLLDPGLNYEHLGKETIDNKTYNIVKVSFDSKDDTPKDIYQIYINKETGLVDQFLFTVADFGLFETPLLMQVDYEEVDGFLIPNKRKYKKSTWKAEIDDAPWTHVTWTNIKFNNGLTKADFNI
jgi:hypothetical protein